MDRKVEGDLEWPPLRYGYIEKSKKISEVQKVIVENDNLHKKILAQEEDFRLQNQTLLNELSIVSCLKPSNL